MDNSTPLVAWVFLVSGATIGVLVAVTAGVFAWYQRRVAAEARRWGRHLMAAQDEERQRIARELHDDFVPRLYGAGLAIERDDPAEAHNQIDGVMTQLRGLAHELHPPALGHLDLQRALEDLVARHQAPGHPLLHLECAKSVTLPADVAVALYRVAQEGLSNARKHARATTITIVFGPADGALRLTVRDDGVGLPEDERARIGFGMRSMRERIEALGGELQVESWPGMGTAVAAVIPGR